MCQQHRILYPRCGHRDTVLAPCEFRDTGIRGAWGRRMPCQKVMVIEKDPNRVCLKCSSGQTSPLPDTNASMIRKPEHKSEPPIQITQSQPKRERSLRRPDIGTADEIDVARILVRNETFLRRRERKFHIPEFPVSFSSPSANEISKQIRVNEEFLARRTRGRTFRAHELSSENTYDLYFLACLAHLEAKQALADFNADSSAIDDEMVETPLPRILFPPVDINNRPPTRRGFNEGASSNEQLIDVEEASFIGDVPDGESQEVNPSNALQKQSTQGSHLLELASELNLEQPSASPDASCETSQSEEESSESMDRSISPSPYIDSEKIQVFSSQATTWSEDDNSVFIQIPVYEPDSDNWEHDKWSFQNPHGEFLLSQMRKWMAMPESYNAWDIRAFFHRHHYLIDFIRRNRVLIRPLKAQGHDFNDVRGSEPNFEGNQMFLLDREMLDWDEVQFVMQHSLQETFTMKAIMGETSSDVDNDNNGEVIQVMLSEEPKSESDASEHYLVPVISREYAKLQPHEVGRFITPYYVRGQPHTPYNIRFRRPSPLRASTTHLGYEVMAKSVFEAFQVNDSEQPVSPLSNDEDIYDMYDDVSLSDEDNDYRDEDGEEDAFAEPNHQLNADQVTPVEVNSDASQSALVLRPYEVTEEENGPATTSSPSSSFSQTVPTPVSPLSPTAPEFQTSPKFNQHMATIKQYLNLPAATNAYQISQHLWMHSMMIQNVREGKLSLKHNFEGLEEADAQDKARTELLDAVSAFEAVESVGNWI